MKRNFIFWVCVAVIFFSGIASAEIRSQDLGKKIVLTQEAALMMQVDTVSLYLSSNRVAFAPHLVGGKVIKVETTILAGDLVSNQAKMNDFVSRLIETFISVLTERLPIYAPSIATSFDPAKDILFVINAGLDRKPVGVWMGGKLSNEPASALTALEAISKPSTDINEVRVLETGEPSRKGCNCPARR